MADVAEYTIHTIDLTSASTRVIQGPWSLVAILDARDVSGNVVPGAQISVGAELEGAAAPMSPGDRFMVAGTKRWYLEWAAQAVTMTIGFAGDPKQVDWEPKPTAVVLSGQAAATPTAAAVTVGTTEVQVVALNSARKGLSVRNTGTANVYIGATGLSTADGFLLEPGDVWAEANFTGALHAISGSAAQEVRYLETQ